MADGPVFATPDWEQRLERHALPLDLGRYLPLLNERRCERAVEIFGRLRLPDVPRQPLNADTVGEWMFDIVRLAAGGLQEDGSQVVQTLLACVSKKQGKTSASAALMITLVLMSPRPNAEFLMVGPTQEIAQLAFRQATGIILADTELRTRFRIREHIKRIEHIESGCFLSIRSFDAKILTGVKASAVLLDEVHLLNSDEANRVVGQIRGAGAAIKEAQLIMITTHADRPAAGFWKQELNKARRIRDAKLDVPNYVPLLWEPPRRHMNDLASVCDPAVWEMTNPNLGYSVDIEWLKRSFKEAAAIGEDETKRWLSQHANAEISQFSSSTESWSGTDIWPSCAYAALSIDWILEHCDRFALGFDGGGADDISTLAVIGIDSSNIWYVWTRSWIWPIALERRLSLNGLLRDFERSGDLRIVDPGVDMIEIATLTHRIYQHTPMGFHALGCDPNGVAGELANECEKIGVPRDKILAVAQGFKLRPGWISLERRLRQGMLLHANQAILNWSVSNCRQDPTSGLITKKASGVGKIDPIVACAIASVVALDVPIRGWDVRAMIG